jgi:hypothetical protein
MTRTAKVTSRHCPACDLYWTNLEFVECEFCGSTETEVVEDEYTECNDCRLVPFDPDMPCDACGQLGAFDFMGDGLCPNCLQ